MAFRARCLRAPRALVVKPVRPTRRGVIAKAEGAIAAPYANGLIDLAQERNILDAVYSDLMGLQAMIATPDMGADGERPEKNELRDFLLGVPLGNEKRKEVIMALGKECSMKPETVDFLKLLTDTSRLDCLEDIITVFEEKYNKLTETQIVTLKSAARLEQDQEFEIAKQLQEVTKSKNIKIKPVIDESLIGGFIVEFGDNMVDLSVKSHLERISSELKSASVAV